MIGWLVRGITSGRITTRYPRKPEPAPDGFRGRVEVTNAQGGDRALEGLCPTGAITVGGGGAVTLDRGRCILCGECVRVAPERFAYGRGSYETAARSRGALVSGDPTGAGPLRPPLREIGPALGRSIHVRHIDCGSDGSEEWEIQALWNPYYDIQRLGFFLTNAPRHADILIATGGVTGPMREPLERTWEVMPAPKALIAVGTDACSGGLSASVGSTAGGVDAVLPVDVYVPGSPPAPITIMHALLLAVGQLAVSPVTA